LDAYVFWRFVHRFAAFLPVLKRAGKDVTGPIGLGRIAIDKTAGID
jgi:hypothetical protein